jgi:hypothetical protein
MLKQLVAKARDDLRNTLLKDVFDVKESSEIKEEQLAEMFKALDANGDGTIQQSEFREVAVSLGFEPSSSELDLAIKAFDYDGDGSISYLEFIKFVKGGDGQPTDPSPKKAYRICLTGGPCGGKTTAMATLREQLSRIGFHIALVPEAATTAFSGWGGYDMAWVGNPAASEVQGAILKFQKAQEDMFLHMATQTDKRVVIICDRGTMDGEVFSSAEDWQNCLVKTGESTESLFSRYDLVVQLTTAAEKGYEQFYEWGEGSNNAARYHNPEQARECDEKCKEVYAKHPEFKVVPNCPTFEGKMELLVQNVTSALRCQSMGEQSRRTLELSSQVLDHIPLRLRAQAEVVEVLAVYLYRCGVAGGRCGVTGGGCSGVIGTSGAASQANPKAEEGELVEQLRRQRTMGDLPGLCNWLTGKGDWSTVKWPAYEMDVEGGLQVARQVAESFATSPQYERWKRAATDGEGVTSVKSPATEQEYSRIFRDWSALQSSVSGKYLKAAVKQRISFHNPGI